MKKYPSNRPDTDTHFFNRARTAAERSTCRRRKVGAIIVRDGVEVSSGYVGAPRGTEHCIDRGKCLRIDLGIPSGERYELCRSVHAEQNAIINAARIGTSILGAKMYISSKRIPGKYRNKDHDKNRIYGPCIICKKEIINAGLVEVFMREENIGTASYTDEQLKRMLEDEEQTNIQLSHSPSIRK